MKERKNVSNAANFQIEWISSTLVPYNDYRNIECQCTVIRLILIEMFASKMQYIDYNQHVKTMKYIFTTDIVVDCGTY